MGKILKDATLHRREIAVSFTAHEVNELLTKEAARIAGVATATFKLAIHQEKEGSPSCNVDRWSASVILTVDL